MMNINLFTPEGLLFLAAALLSIACDWFPPVRNRYDDLTAGPKRFWMAVAMFTVAVIITAGACFGLMPSQNACSPTGVGNMLILLIMAIAINQGFHAGTKPA